MFFAEIRVKSCQSGWGRAFGYVGGPRVGAAGGQPPQGRSPAELWLHTGASGLRMRGKLLFNNSLNLINTFFLAEATTHTASMSGCLCLFDSTIMAA